MPSGPSTTHIAERLLDGLRSGDPSVRVRAAAALGQIGQSVDDVGAVLARVALEDLDSTVRAEAVNAVADLGVSEAELLRVAIDLLEHPDQTVRARAGWAIGKLDPAIGEGAVPHLEQRVAHDPAIDGRFGAVWALGRMRLSSEQAIRSLQAGLRDREPDVRAEAARALGRTGHAAVAAAADLARLHTDGDPLVREQVAIALGLVDEGSPVAVTALRDLAADHVPSVRRAAEASLARSGATVGARPRSTDGPVAPVVDRAKQAARLADDDDFGRAEAAWLIAKEGDTVDVETTLQLVLRSLVDRDSDARWAAVRSVGRVGARSEAVTMAILLVLEHDRDPDVRQAAVSALASLWSDAPAHAIGGLVTALRDRDAMVREDAADSLGSIGPAASTARDALEVAATSDPHGGVRARAAASLAAIGTT